MGQKEGRQELVETKQVEKPSFDECSGEMFVETNQVEHRSGDKRSGRMNVVRPSQDMVGEFFNDPLAR